MATLTSSTATRVKHKVSNNDFAVATSLELPVGLNIGFDSTAGFQFDSGNNRVKFVQSASAPLLFPPAQLLLAGTGSSGPLLYNASSANSPGFTPASTATHLMNNGSQIASLYNDHLEILDNGSSSNLINRTTSNIGIRLNTSTPSSIDFSSDPSTSTAVCKINNAGALLVKTNSSAPNLATTSSSSWGVGIDSSQVYMYCSGASVANFDSTGLNTSVVSIANALDCLYGYYTSDSTISSATTLAADQYNRNLTISSATVKPSGFRIVVTGTLTLTSGNINADGNAGSSSTGGTAVTNGGQGGNGSGTGSVANSSNRLGGLGGTGGKGLLTSTAGAVAGSATVPTAVNGDTTVWNTPYHAVCGINLAGARCYGGTGGGGGGIDSSAAGGGAGSGAGIVWVLARKIVVNSSCTISAIGGAGASGLTSGSNRGGGGGGGGGGVVVLIYASLDTTNGTLTRSVAGGTGGSGGNSNNQGTDGAVGSLFEIQHGYL